MSVEFTLKNNVLTDEQWDSLMENWSEARNEPLYVEPHFNEEKQAHLFGPGSIRGAVFLRRVEDNEVDLRLNALSSRTDWRMGFEVLWMAIKRGGGSVERESGESYGLAMLSSDQAERDAIRDFAFSVRAMSANFRKEGASTATLPMGIFDLPVTVADFPEVSDENIDDIETALAERVEKYASAFPASVFKLTGGATISTWALIPTLVGEVDLIALPKRANSDKEAVHVPLARLKELLGARAVTLGSTTYLPAMDEEEDHALLDTVRQESVPFPETQEAPKQRDEEMARLIKLVVGRLVDRLFEGGNPEDVMNEMIEGGLDKGIAKMLFAVTAMTVKGLSQDGQSPEEIAADLISKGAPEDVIVTAITAVLDSFAEHQDDE